MIARSFCREAARFPFRCAVVLAAHTVTVHALIEPGEILIGEMNCVACHEAAPAVKERLDSRQSPRLGAGGVKLTPQWLQAFLTDPQAETPGTLMPDMLHALAPAEKAAAADALTHFLVSLQPAESGAQATASDATSKTGEQLYHSLGCVLCHAPFVPPPEKTGAAAADDAMAKLARTSVPLGDLAKKYTVGAFAAFLRDPVRTRPSGRMPALKLNDGEARAIAMYLLRAQVPAGPATKLAGLTYEYYAQQLRELPEFDRLQPDAAGIVETFTLAVAKRKNDYALCFRGILTAPLSGDYKFYTSSEAGIRLYLDEKLIVDNPGIHPTLERSATVKLNAGEHAITVGYFDSGGQSEMKIDWQPPGGSREAIPTKMLA